LHRHIGYAQVRVVKQAFGALQPSGFGHLERACVQVSSEQPCQMARPDADARRQRIDGGVLAIEHSVANDQPSGSIDNSAAAPPCSAEWRRFRAAPQARPEASRLCCCRAGKKTDVFGACRTHGTDRATINAGRPHAGEEPTIIGWISRDPRTLALVVIQHRVSLSYRAARWGRSPNPARFDEA